MESESLLKVTELLSVQQINTHEANNSTENFITVKGTGKNKKIKLNHQQDSRIPLRNSFEILPIEESQDKRNLLRRKTQYHLHLIKHLVKEDKKKQPPKQNKQPEA